MCLRDVKRARLQTREHPLMHESIHHYGPRCSVSLHSNSHFFGQLILFLPRAPTPALSKGVQSLSATPLCESRAATRAPFRHSVFTERSRVLRTRAAGFSSTLHLIDPLIAGMGWSSDTCSPPPTHLAFSQMGAHLERETQRCCSKRLHVCCVVGLFQSDYWLGRDVKEQPSEGIKHTGRIQVPIKQRHGSFELVFCIVHLCK